MNEQVSDKPSDLLNTENSPESRRITRRDLFLVLLAGIILNIPFLGLRDIWSSGEARVAQVARQMRSPGGNWIIPELGDEPRLKKPPLAYWLTVIASLPFDDVDEFNSRLPNALSGIGVMLLIYLIGCGLFDRRAGLVSAIACGNNRDFMDAGANHRHRDAAAVF